MNTKFTPHTLANNIVNIETYATNPHVQLVSDSLTSDSFQFFTIIKITIYHGVGAKHTHSHAELLNKD